MNSKLAWALVGGLWCAWSNGQAQTAAPERETRQTRDVHETHPSLVIDSDEQIDRNEPNVKHVLIEDKGSKIEELRVRGQTQHIIVTPKVGKALPYEILVAPGGRDLTTGTGGPRNTTGTRVWSLLNF